MLSTGELEQIAACMPSMGGAKIGPLLRDLARNAPAGTAIVEVGTWLGAGTAQLALGVRERAERIPIHCFDRFQANANEVEKARLRGVTLSVGQDTLPIAKSLLAPFDVPIEFHKSDLMKAKWKGPPISVYVDDAAKRQRHFDHMLGVFGPRWIPGVTKLVLMDFLLWRKKNDEGLKYQQQFIESHPDNFVEIARPAGGGGVAFLYAAPLKFSKRDSFLSVLKNLMRN